MIDGIKAILTDNLDEIRNNPLLDFDILVSKKTGEIKNKKFSIAKYKGLTFIDKGSIIEVRGSIHVMNNNGKHNYNKFGLSEIHLVLYELADILGIVTNHAELKNIEFGVNLIIDFEPRNFLNSLILHNRKMFTHQKSRNMQFRECGHGQYYIKIYDKGLQHGLNQHILRIELKFIKMEKINGFGIKFLSDLLDPRKLEKLRIELLRVFDEILIGDINITPEGLSEKDMILFANGLNPNYWDTKSPKTINYKDGASDKAYKRDVKSFQREMYRFKSLSKDTGADKLQNQVRNMIDVVSTGLLQQTRNKFSSTLKCPELTKLDSVINEQKMSRIDQVDKSNGLSRIDTLFYSDKNVQTDNRSKRFCIVTGLDISMQKPGSIFLCSEGIKFYKKYYSEIYLQLWKRLNPRWHGSSEKVQIQEIHHSIRNEYFNRKHNTKRSIKRVMEEPALFNQLELIDRNKLGIAGMLG